MINYVVLLQNTGKEIIYSPDIYHETPNSENSSCGCVIHKYKAIIMLKSVLRNINPHSIGSFEQNNKSTGG